VLSVRPWVLIDKSATPDGAALELWQRDEEFSIRTAGHELMGSRMYDSEALLAELAVAALGKAAQQRVLIGGLGCGYTLAAALKRLGPRARVRVDEISPAVVAWNRGVLGSLAGHPMRDRRVAVHEADVVDDLLRNEDPLELILLDVDNGPSALSQARNAWLYRGEGLARLHARLSPRGVLGVWSAGPDPRFAKRLRSVGFVVEEHLVRASGSRGKRHVVWIARRV
jgi:spermidine synthase